VFDTERPIRSTADMLPWYSGKACEHTKRSQINMCVYDSRWEANESLELDRNQNVRAWVKNDHIGFEITYSFKLKSGIERRPSCELGHLHRVGTELAAQTVVA
jgi:type III restriction enzyme